MTRSFAEKLSLTAVVLGCATRKELAARFRAINPATEFDVERSYKWLQGRSLPRSRRVYDDWAQVLSIERGGDWLAACTTDAFLDELCVRFSADRDHLSAGAAAFARPPTELPEGAGADYVCGTFVAYSWAWSPYHRGELIRGHLELAATRRGQLAATYGEVLPSGPVRCTGLALRMGQGLHAQVDEPTSGGRERLSFTLLVPGRPANVLCGHLQGTVIMGPEPQPSTSRIVLVRLTDDAAARRRRAGCYLRPVRDALADDLEAEGFAPDRATDLAAAILDFVASHVTGGADCVTLADLAHLANVVDRPAPGIAAD